MKQFKRFLRVKLELIVVFFAFCYSGSLLAQDVNLVNELASKYSDEKAIYTNKSEHIFIETKRNEFSIRTEIVEDILYLSDHGSAYARNSMHFSSFTAIEDVEAYTLVPKGKPGKYKKKKVTYFETKDAQSSGIFFDDQKKITFDFEGIQKGTTSHLSYTEVHKDPKMLGRNFFVYGLPAIQSEVAISFPDNVEIGYRLFNVDSSSIEFVKEKKGKVNHYRWVAKNIEGSDFLGDGPNFSYYTPHIILYVKQIHLKDSSIKVLPDVAALYDWYYSLVKDVNQEENETLKGIVDSLMVGENDRDEKARKIFNWVQDNIKYVAFEDGMGGFVPRQAATVCQKRYGDCKDMASIITTMLKYAGIKGNLTWIGSRDLPYRYSENHTPSVDNHMIASYRNKQDEVVFLDAVGSYTPYGYPTGFIQGKEALISLGKDSFEIKQVPIIDKSKNSYKDYISLSIEKNELKGKGNITAEGYAKLDFVYPLINKVGKKRKERFNSMLEKGNNKFIVNSLDIKGIDDRDQPLNITYDCTIGDYISINKKEIYVNLNIDKSLKSWKIDVKKRKGVSLEFDYAQDIDLTVDLKIPKGYAVSYIPELEEFKGKDFGFKVSYTQSKGKLRLHFTFYRSILEITADSFEEWNKMIKLANRAYKESVILKKK